MKERLEALKRFEESKQVIDQHNIRLLNKLLKELK